MDSFAQPLTFDYSMQAHRETGKFLFTVISPCEPPSAAANDRSTGPANNMQRYVTPQHMPHSHLEHIKLMEEADLTQLAIA